MAQIVHLEKPNLRRPNPDGFILTETAEEIFRSLTLVRSIRGPAATMISGAPGVGKTEALCQFARQEQTAVYISIAKGEGNPYHVASTILKAFQGYRDRLVLGRGLTEAREVVGRSLGLDRILLVDEAQHLFQRHKESNTKGAAFGWLVAASEESGFDLVFCGDLTLPMIMEEFPHLRDRMRRPVVIKNSPRADIEAMAAADGIEGNAETALLCAVAGMGGLRNVENVIRMAAIFAGKDRITAGHLKAAIIDLKLSPQGGK